MGSVLTPPTCSVSSLHTASFHKMSFNIFVYGTLKTGEPNHYWFEEASTSLTAVELVGPGVTQERLPLITATEFNIPMLLDSPGDGLHIKGEVYRIDQKILDHLDILEAHPTLYNRRLMKVVTEGHTLDCWTYMISDFREELLTEEFIEEYSSKITPWNAEYLKHKDGDYLYNLVRNKS